jgi:tRNA threonylcarbamoyladenosine biosynthesis protein TsaB
LIVLGFDTATPSTAVGLRMADGETLVARDDPGPGGRPGHATRLLALTDELLAGAGVAWGALDRIAVGLGPGRFTGLRVGIATARGLAQSLSLELVGVSSLRALAAAAAERGAPGRHEVLSVIDARRGEAFAAAYSAIDHRLGDELVFESALAPEELESVVAQAQELGVGRGQRWLAVGDGAVRFRGQLEAAGVSVPADSSPLHLVNPEAICALGASTPAVSSYEEIIPDYRRRPDAEMARAGVAALGSAGP